jgi:hypothetical protein
MSSTRLHQLSWGELHTPETAVQDNSTLSCGTTAGKKFAYKIAVDLKKGSLQDRHWWRIRDQVAGRP